MLGSSVQVFKYLFALENMMVPAVRGLQDYNDTYWWQSELPVGEGYLMGLRFWRIRGSNFYRNRDKALESLWAKLMAMGIEPQRK